MCFTVSSGVAVLCCVAEGTGADGLERKTFRDICDCKTTVVLDHRDKIA
jgi:hypothetical protein